MGCYASSDSRILRNHLWLIASFLSPWRKCGKEHSDSSANLTAVLREHPEIKVYSVSPFDLDERRRFKDRFGGDIVYFLNDAAAEMRTAGA